jgi:NAD+ kinase
MIRAAGIISKPIQAILTSVVPPLVKWLQERKVAVYADKETEGCVQVGVTCVEREKLAGQVDLLIVLGGDGTLLSAARALGDSRTPILAVNLGGLGFLTSVTLDELYPVLAQVLAGQQRTSERMMLDAETSRRGRVVDQHRALNDAVAHKAALSRMHDFDVYVDKVMIGRYRADGLIVATPTGSTAYSLAAGGPIVHPDLDAFVITPICPHMLTNRPLVIPGAARIEIQFPAGEEPVYLTLDGQIGFALEANDRVAITKSATKVVYIRSPQKSYFEVLRSKLRWGER